MAQILSQDEVDSLLTGINSGEVQTDGSPAVESTAGQPATNGSSEEIRPYDFTHSEIAISGRLPGLDIIFNKFTRRLRNIYTTELGKSVDVGFESIEAALYEDLVKRIPLPSSIHLVRLDPLRGLGVFVIEAPLAYAMVDLFFGGSGQRVVKVEGRDFTPIETNFLGKFVDKMLRGMEEAWASVIQVEGRYIRSEVNPYLLGATAMGDVMIITKYKISLAGVMGQIVFAFPISAVEQVRERLKSPFMMSGDGGDTDGLGGRLRMNIRTADVDIHAVVDVINLSIREILSLSPGDLLQLDPNAMERTELWVEGKPLFRGRAGQTNGNKVFVVSGAVPKQ